MLCRSYKLSGMKLKRASPVHPLPIIIIKAKFKATNLISCEMETNAASDSIKTQFNKIELMQSE